MKVGTGSGDDLISLRFVFIVVFQLQMLKYSSPTAIRESSATPLNEHRVTSSVESYHYGGSYLLSWLRSISSSRQAHLTTDRFEDSKKENKPPHNRMDVLEKESDGTPSRQHERAHSTRAHISALTEELNTSMAEQVTLKDELQDSMETCDRLGRQKIALQDELESSVEEKRHMQEHIVDLQKQLTDKQDFVFSLQRREQKVTESEAATDFNSICIAVEEWVQTKLGDGIEQRSALEAESFASKMPAIRKFLALIPQPGYDAFGYPDTDEFNVTAAIMHFLKVEIFDKDFYCPIEGGAMDFLTSIEIGMRVLEPRRGRLTPLNDQTRRLIQPDLITLRTWRAETLSAVTKRPTFTQRRQTHSQNLSIKLNEMLHVFIPHSNGQNLFHSIQNSIIEPALQMAHKLHLSVDRFTLRYTNWHERRMANRQPIHTPIDSMHMDCVMVSPPGKALKFPVQRGVLTYLLELSPALVFEAAKTDSWGDKKELKASRILVAHTEANDAPYHGDASRSREIPTLLGLLAEEIHGA